jgi:hypothetical protein
MVLVWAAGSHAVGAEPVAVSLEVADILAQPGESLEVSAKLEVKGPRGVNLPGLPVRFLLDDRPLGEGRGDARGVSVVSLKAPEAGDHRLTAIFAGDATHQRAEYNALLAVRAPGTPILAVDVDWTLASTDNLNTAMGGSDCPPLEGAAQAMRRLGERYTIVYVTCRARQLRKRTISWLARYGFPAGPSTYVDPRLFPTFDLLAYRKSVLLPLKKAFPGFAAGLGNDPEDLAAYREAGLATVLLTAKPVAGAVCASNWGGVEKALETALAASRAR